MVSIGMPVYNAEGTLRAAIDSILGQSHPNFVLFISDNCSSDLTEQICRDYAARDERIQYTRQIRNIGALENFRFVLEQSRTEYFIWAAADDTRSPDYLEVNLQFLEKNPDFIASTSPTRYVNGNFDPIRMGDEPLSGTEENRFLRFFTSWHANGRFYSLFRRDVIRECSLQEEHFLGSDWATVLRCSLLGKFHRTEQGWTQLGRHGTSSSARIFELYQNRWYERFFPLFELTRTVLALTKDFSVLTRARLVLRLMHLNAIAVWYRVRLAIKSFRAGRRQQTGSGKAPA